MLRIKTEKMSRTRATIIYNPMSGRPGRRAENALDMVRLLDERGIEAEACATTAPHDATRIAAEALSSGREIIVSYGGDGTLNEVIQSMVGHNAALAVWAGGTANVVARDLQLPFQTEVLADTIARGKTRRIALGKAEISDNGSDPASRYFLMFVGIGLDAAIARSVNRRLKRVTGEFAYWVTGIKHLVGWRAEPFDLEVDGKKYEGVFALLGNGKGYGGGLSMTPEADLDQPWFDVFILPRRANNFLYLPDLAACMRGRAGQTSALVVRGRHVKAISSFEHWVQADGEIIGPLPMTFDIVPDALSIIVP